MHLAHTLKRDLFLGRDLFLAFALTAFVFMCALAWGSPFVSTGAFAATAQASQAQTTVFTGTVMRNGEQFVLRDAGGQIYRLDDPQHAQSFEGKTVKVTGKLDSDTKLIHVVRIEPAAA
jgi:uncharacterized protein YdeI (BOF family)